MNTKHIGSNMTLVTTNDGAQVLVSYETPVAAFVPGVGYVRTEQYYSRTTSKHINKWLDGKDARPYAQEFLNSLLES